MQVHAKSKYVRFSPYKLRPIVSAIRGNSLDKAVAWLNSQALKKVRPILKVVLSAYANSKNLNSASIALSEFVIKDIRVDAGPIVKYYKPGAMGRAMVQRKRLSHLQVTLQRKDNVK